MATAGAQPVYFELSWSILSTIGLTNALFGVLVAGITTFSQIHAVPIVTSLSCALANGLCYYAFYHESYPVTNRAIASAFADIAWMVQEAGYSFYSYMILSRVLRNRSRLTFKILFWACMVGILGLRISIAVLRVGIIRDDNNGTQDLINHLHVGYFVLIAIVECISSYFLLRTFYRAKVLSRETAIQTDLMRHLMRSTEGRLALLALLGTMRAITYSFQVSAQSATSVASQLDRFAYTLECMFPIMMLIDILASRLVHHKSGYNVTSSRRRRDLANHIRTGAGHPSSLDTATDAQKRNYNVNVQGGPVSVRRTSSEERIIPDHVEQYTSSPIGLQSLKSGQINVKKTVDVQVYPADR